MCHTHQPGDGIHRMEVRRGQPFYELVVQLASDDCTYVLPVNILGQLAGGFNQRNNPPALAFTTSGVIYETKCHVPRVAHDHHLADLHRLEVERVGNRLWFSTAVTACNCHVRFPVELAARLFMAAVTGDLANLTSHHHATNLPQGVRPAMDEAELEAFDRNNSLRTNSEHPHRRRWRPGLRRRR